MRQLPQHGGLQMTNRRNSAWLVAGLAMALCNLGFAEAIEDVRMSRRANVASAEVALGCGMRYVDHQPREGGTELRISLGLEPDCARVISSLHSELRRPRGGDMGAIGDVEFNRTAPGRATLIFRFQVPVRFNINQGANFNTLRVDITRDGGAPQPIAREPLPTLTPAPSLPPTPSEAVVKKTTPTNRAPLRLTENAWLTQDQFVVQLGAYSKDAVADLTGLDFNGHQVYESRVAAGEDTWRVMRIGFFPTEAAARVLLEELPSERFPEAFIAAASPAEQARAANSAYDGSSAPAVANNVPTQSTMPPQQITALLGEAKIALREGNYDRSIQVYNDLLQEAETGHRGEAREFLGLARERNGQLAQAKAEYQAYLAEFPNSPGANRVRQRLAGLAATETTTLVQRPARSADVWDLAAGVAQYYRRDVLEPVTDAPATVQQSTIISQTDVLLRRQGERFDLAGRFNGSYYYDLEQNPATSGDQGYVSYAYLDFVDRDLDISARLGRQSQYSGGVLGRFDGLRFSYRWRPDIAINANAGFPNDSPRVAFSSRRFFYGASIDLENVADRWDFSAFFHLQDVDGISDRQAIGGEIRYLHGNWNVVAMTDYDVSYNILNSVLAAATWRPTNRISFNSRVNFGAAPFVTTRNALIGQPFTTIEGLGENYSEGQLRRIARNRTAQAGYGSVGMSAAVTEKFQINADVGYSFHDNTIASAGVASLPETGGQTYLSTSLVGSSVFKTGDTTVLTYRLASTDRADSHTASIDLRYPIGNNLRISPRLAWTLRTNSDSTDQWIAQPNLRATWRWQRRFRLELELGGLWSSQDLPANTLIFSADGSAAEDTSAYYINAGYWMDF